MSFFKRKDGKELRNYNCPWCGHKFKQWVGKHISNNEHNLTAKHKNGSDQVKCPNCTNFLKTW